jgi:hypothetical protein
LTENPIGQIITAMLKAGKMLPPKFLYGLLLLVVILGFSYRELPPTVKIELSGQQMLVHVHKFGSLWPTVSQIRIIDRSSSATVIDLVPSAGIPCLGLFSLRQGSNSVSDINGNANCGMFQSVPVRQRAFSLEKRHSYLLSIWGRHLLGTHTDTVFEFD